MAALDDLPPDMVQHKPEKKKNTKKIKKFKIKKLNLLKLKVVKASGDEGEQEEEEDDDDESNNTNDTLLEESILEKHLDLEWPNLTNNNNNNNKSEDHEEKDTDEAGESLINGDGEEEEEEEDEVNGDTIIDDLDLNQEESSPKTFKERAAELMKKTQGEHSYLVQRVLNAEDWLFIHRIIRKSKGLKSKFMMRNLNPFLFDLQHVISWNCRFCKQMIPAPSKNYIDHLIDTHGVGVDEDPTFPCDVCGDYVKKDKYVVHWVPHFMEHECPICKKTFALNCHMRYHYKVVHEEGEQTCFQCGKLLKNDLAMRRHLRLFHSNRTTWKICDICGKCVKARCLEPHKKTHSQDRPYKCDTCKKCFKTPSTLYQHQKVHATDSKAHKYLCEYCGKRFKHHTSWNLHVVRIHEGEYEHECPICHKRFHKLFELKKHSVKHSEVRPFPCLECGKHFKTKTHLKEHVTIHSDSKSHICPLCGKGIRMKANLYKHLKVHRNRGEYVPPLNGNSTNSLFNSVQNGLLSPSSSTYSISRSNSSTFANSTQLCSKWQSTTSTSSSETNTMDNKSTTNTAPLLVNSNIQPQQPSLLVPSPTTEAELIATPSVQSINLPIRDSHHTTPQAFNMSSVASTTTCNNTITTTTSDTLTSSGEETDYSLLLTLANNSLFKDTTAMLMNATNNSSGNNSNSNGTDAIQDLASALQQQILVLQPSSTASAIMSLQEAITNATTTSTIPNTSSGEAKNLLPKLDSELLLATISDGTLFNVGHHFLLDSDQMSSLPSLETFLPGSSSINLEAATSSNNNIPYGSSSLSTNILALLNTNTSSITTTATTPNNDNSIRLSGATHLAFLVNQTALGGMTFTPLQTE